MGLEAGSEKTFLDELHSERKLRSKNQNGEKRYTFEESEE